jgi:hypothetical protein
VQINPVGHPRLCWQAGGNGSGVTLERCDPAVAGQQWSLTSNGVVMNGNSYCLEASTEAGTAAALYIDFAGQCAGEGPGNGHIGRGQVWQYRAGQLASAGTGACAGPGRTVAPGAPVVRRPCSSLGPAGARWSIGYSAVTVAPGSGGGPAGGTFTASVTVANAASAQAAYGVAVTFTLPPPLAATALRITGRATGRITGPSGWTCDVRTLTCTGTLPSGASRRVAITGHLPAAARPGTSYTVRARAAVTGTSQRRGTPRTATTSLRVPVHPAAPRPAAGIRSPLLTISAGAAVLLLAGALLVFAARRRPRHAARRRAPAHARTSPPA